LDTDPNAVARPAEPWSATPGRPSTESPKGEHSTTPPTTRGNPGGGPWDLELIPSRSWVALNLRELWEYRELLYFLVWRDIKVRYKQTVLGAAWAILQPAFTMVVFTLFFGRLAGLGSRIEGGAPYSVWAFAGLVPWSFFAQGLNQSANSLVGSADLLKKVYFPRLVIPLASVLAGLVDFALAFLFLVGLIAWFGIIPGGAVILLPAFLLLALSAALGVGLWLAALNVLYRDIRHTLPFLVQLWLFATPVAYPSTLVPEPWRTFYGLNPMAGVVEGFRWALLGGPAPGPILSVSAVAALLIMISGAFFFRRMERTYADTV
jgi:lipopolysaccharide transport system permease protein